MNFKSFYLFSKISAYKQPIEKIAPEHSKRTPTTYFAYFDSAAFALCALIFLDEKRAIKSAQNTLNAPDGVL